eukprot:scaffold977_cov286-Pavlova_lutheri.AAC.1
MDDPLVPQVFQDRHDFCGVVFGEGRIQLVLFLPLVDLVEQLPVWTEFESHVQVVFVLEGEEQLGDARVIHPIEYVSFFLDLSLFLLFGDVSFEHRLQGHLAPVGAQGGFVDGAVGSVSQHFSQQEVFHLEVHPRCVHSLPPEPIPQCVLGHGGPPPSRSPSISHTRVGPPSLPFPRSQGTSRGGWVPPPVFPLPHESPIHMSRTEGNRGEGEGFWAFTGRWTCASDPSESGGPRACLPRTRGVTSGFCV